jgi:hypothetical protein
MALTRSNKSNLLSVAIATAPSGALAATVVRLPDHPRRQLIFGALLKGGSANTIAQLYFARRSGCWPLETHSLASPAVYGDFIEEGDIRRAIGFHGDTNHVSQRKNRKAQELGANVATSGAVAGSLYHRERDGLKRLSEESVRLISHSIGKYTLVDSIPERASSATD